MSNRQALQQAPLPTVPTPATAAAAITKSKIDYVQVDALVALKLVKHCHELNGGNEIAQGVLTGMVQGSDNSPKRIEVTNCFPLPNPNTFKGTTAEYDEGKLINLLSSHYL